VRFGAKSGFVTARGWLQTRGGGKKGAILIQDGPLSAGLDVKPDGISVHPFPDGDWRKARHLGTGSVDSPPASR
jgi:hypothetical protein